MSPVKAVFLDLAGNPAWESRAPEMLGRADDRDDLNPAQRATFFALTDAEDRAAELLEDHPLISAGLGLDQGAKPSTGEAPNEDDHEHLDQAVDGPNREHLAAIERADRMLADPTFARGLGLAPTEPRS